jgi:sulfide:quinone oxidoreductase
MAKVVILGGGFAGVVAAERLAAELGEEHEITLVSRSRRFVFYPALVRLAFGKCEPDDVSFDLRETMLRRRVNFIESEVARFNPEERKVILAHGDVHGHLSYDYLIYALGRRLATERITGFYEHANHLLGVQEALQFRHAISSFHQGRAVIGECPGARLPVPVYETAFALAQLLEERGERDRTRITVVRPDAPGPIFDDSGISSAIKDALTNRGIELVSDFPIETITQGALFSSNKHGVNFNLVMLVPPFQGSAVASYLGITDDESYVNVDWNMRVVGLERTYAVGDCVNFSGPKLGHMAVRQGEVAAANLAAEIAGHGPVSNYVHDMRVVIDQAGGESMYLHKDLWVNELANVKQGRFWSWAKRAQEKYWELSHL